MRDKTSPEAEEGTLLHKHVANPSLDRSALTENQLWLVQSAEEAIQEAVHAVMAENGIADSDMFYGGHEESILLYSEDGDRLFPGTADFYRYWPNQCVLTVLDLKAGFLEQTPAHSNIQVASYAVALGLVHGRLAGVSKAYTGIVSPRAKRGERVTLASYSAASLKEAQRAITKIYADTFEPDAPLNPSEDACRYCSAKLICEAYRARFMTLEEYREKTLTALPFEQFDAVGQAIKLALQIKDDWNAEALRRIDAGGLPGWKKKDNGSTTDVTDAKLAYSLLKEALPSMTADDFMSAVTLKVGAARELAKKHSGLSEAKAKALVENVLASITIKTPKSPSPVREK